jgi:hypothetical protein
MAGVTDDEQNYSHNDIADGITDSEIFIDEDGNAGRKKEDADDQGKCTDNGSDPQLSLLAAEIGKRA